MTMSESARPKSMDSNTTAWKSAASRNTISIRRVLLLSIIGITTLVLLVASVFSYRAGLQEAGELFDAKLAHSSRVLMSLVDEPLADLALRSDGATSADDAMVIKVWRGTSEGVGEALAMPTATPTKRNSPSRCAMRAARCCCVPTAAPAVRWRR